MIPRPRLPRHPEDRPFVLGHRGARAHAPENTLRAFHRALKDGADGIEMDVRMTSDGRLVVAHDDMITFDGQNTKLSLSRLTFGQLQELSIAGGEKVPTLTQVLRFQAETGCLVNVELKAQVLAPQWMPARAAAEIRAHGGHGIFVSSFSPWMTRTMARELPHVPCALLIEASQNWTLRALPLGALGAVGAHPEASRINPELVRRIHAKNAFVGAWTVNDPARARELAQMQVDVLISDDPAKILAALVSGA